MRFIRFLLFLFTGGVTSVLFAQPLILAPEGQAAFKVVLGGQIEEDFFSSISSAP